jgi:predicted RNA-binding Zn-ribbon protein involved in translation (DUF1610 family)
MEIATLGNVYNTTCPKCGTKLAYTSRDIKVHWTEDKFGVVHMDTHFTCPYCFRSIIHRDI